MSKSVEVFFNQPENSNVALTENGAIAYESTLDLHLDFFATAGSKYNNRLHSKEKLEVHNETEELQLFIKLWKLKTERPLSLKLLFWLRNIPRNSESLPGAGNRSGFKNILQWLATYDPKWVIANIAMIPVVGRFDDLEVLVGTPCELQTLQFWGNAITNQNGLACKWMPRKGIVAIKMREHLKLTPKQFRRLLVSGTKVVEQQMCKNEWNEINYPQVPGKAMSMLNKAFTRHDEERFKLFNTKVASGEVKINAGTLFPHDIIKSLLSNGDKMTLRNQWAALPNYLGDNKNNKNNRIIAIADTSGSMSSEVSKGLQAVHISQALALYVSDKIEKSNPFYRKYLQFEEETEFTSWNDKEIDQVVGNRKYFNEACGNTDIYKALVTILQHCKKFELTNDQIPNMLLIVSDMQFDQMNSGRPVEEALKQYDSNSYNRPKIVFWNVACRDVKGLPVTKNEKNVCMISGFATSILKTILSNEFMTPLQIMTEALKDFNVVIPD